MSDFKKSLAVGKVGESLIADWLKSRGCHILPIYEIADNQFKGPALYTSDGGTIIAPDMVAFNKAGITFIEAKHKEAFTWYRKTATWQTGIDLKHFHEYKKMLSVLGYPIWLLFLHRGGQAKDSAPSPAGLFGNSLAVLQLMGREDKRWANGMIYWNIEDLIKLADYPLVVNKEMELRDYQNKKSRSFPRRNLPALI